ncbi:MAG: DNA polymerase III subunit beta [Candidatus Eiseniibacteriota bacterium]
MEFTIQQPDLSYALSTALASVPSKSTIPILSSVLIEAEGDGLRITGTDLDVTTSVTVPCTVKTPGRAAVQARHFADAVRKLPKDQVKVTDDGQGRISVEYGKGKGRSAVPRQNDGEFPALPTVKAEARATIEGPALARLIARSAYAVSGDETRPVLNGVLVAAEGKDLTFVATDGHRLARATRKGEFGGLGKQAVIIPSKTVQALGRMSAEATSPVEIAVSAQRNHIAVRLRIGQNDVMVFSRLLEGPFPNYEQVIPKSNPKTLVVPRIELREALDRVATHSDNITHQVRFALATNEVRLSVNTADVGAGEETVEAKYDGEEIEVGYNAIYLLDILKTIETENVVFRLNTSISAGIVEPEGALSDASEEILCLIMPLRLPEPATV